MLDAIIELKRDGKLKFWAHAKTIAKQNRDSNLLVGYLLSLILALSINVLLKILVYWIPASFLLMYIWALFGLKSYSLKTTTENLDQTMEIYRELNKSKLDSGFSWFFKILSPFMKAISIIHGITIFALILIIEKIINVNVEFSPHIPFISALLFTSSLFFLDNLTNF